MFMVRKIFENLNPAVGKTTISEEFESIQYI